MIETEFRTGDTFAKESVMIVHNQHVNPIRFFLWFVFFNQHFPTNCISGIQIITKKKEHKLQKNKPRIIYSHTLLMLNPLLLIKPIPFIVCIYTYEWVFRHIYCTITTECDVKIAKAKSCTSSI